MDIVVSRLPKTKSPAFIGHYRYILESFYLRDFDGITSGDEKIGSLGLRFPAEATGSS